MRLCRLISQRAQIGEGSSIFANWGSIGVPVKLAVEPASVARLVGDIMNFSRALRVQNACRVAWLGG